jgi:hypothetical protein
MLDTVFMVMPFGDAVANSAYQHSTKPIVESLGYSIRRADEIFSTNPVFDDIVTAIEQCAVVVVDISGRNPNCFYELGMAHTLKRNRTIMITHDAYANAPFDVAHFRILRYENTIEGKSRYEEDLRRTLTSIISGLPELYRGEFQLVADVLQARDGPHSFYFLMTIPKATTPLCQGDGGRVEGHYRHERPLAALGQVDEHLRPFAARKYVEIVGDRYSLTDKGQAFVDFLSSEGYVVDAFEDDVFTPNHVPFWKSDRAVTDSTTSPAIPGHPNIAFSFTRRPW